MKPETKEPKNTTNRQTKLTPTLIMYWTQLLNDIQRCGLGAFDVVSSFFRRRRILRAKTSQYVHVMFVILMFSNAVCTICV